MGANNNESWRVLLADDESSITRLFRSALASAFPHAEIDVVDNGQEAVDSFNLRRHHLCVLDLYMPKMDGLTAYRRIESLCRDRDINMPVVLFCTGYAPTTTLRQIVEENQRVELLLKPIRLPELVRHVREKLQHEVIVATPTD